MFQQHRIKVCSNLPDVTMNLEGRSEKLPHFKPALQTPTMVHWYIHQHVYMTTIICAHIQLLSSLRHALELGGVS